MTFFLRWIRREIQNDRAWVVLFLLSLSLGLFGFVALESFRAALESNLQEKARTFLSADLAASSRRKITDAERDQIRERVKPSRESHLTEFFTMAASDSSSRLVQLKAVDSIYPLYGELKLGSGKVIRTDGSTALEERPVLWVYPELLSQLNVAVGGSVRIGNLNFEIADTVVDDSTQTFRLGSLAPKVYFSRKFLEQTGLIGFGNTSSDVYLFQLPGRTDQQLNSLVQDLEKQFPDPNLQFASPFDRAQDSGRAVQTLLDYLGLVSLVGLALALVGVAYLIQLFLSRRIATFSLLRTLGLKAGQAEGFVLAELALLGLMGSLLVLPLSALALPYLGRLIEDLLPVPLHLSLNGVTLIVCLVLSTVLPVLIAWPLLRPFRRLGLKQVLLDRDLWQARPTWVERLFWVPAGLVFFALSVWVAHSWRTAGLFYVSLIVSAMLIIAVAVLFLKLLPETKGHWRWKQARLRLRRAPLRFSVVILALSFGTLLLVLLPQIRSSLKTELASPESTRLPSLFLFDIQDEQVGGLTDFLREQKIPAQNLSPLVRARLLSVNDRPFERGGERKDFQSREEETDARFRNRGVNLTFREQLSTSEELAEGRWFSTDRGEVAELSVEKKYAERLGLKLGDLLKFDIQGIEMQGRIVNLRTVKWNSFQPNFFISFQPGFLEDAPKTWLASVPPLPEDRKQVLQNELVRRFTNVSIVDVSRVIDKAIELTDQMSTALTGMAALSVLVGLFVLWVVLTTEARSRLVEWNLYKVLGAGRSQVLKLFLVESAVISFIAVATGGLLGILLSYGLLRFTFEAPLTLDVRALILALVLPFVLTFLLSWRLGQRLTTTNASSLLAEGRI